MVGFQVAVGGANKTVTAAYVAVGGVYKQVTNGYVATGGAYKVAFSPAVDFTFSIDPVAGNPFKWKITFTSTNALAAQVYGNWSAIPLASLTPDSNGEINYVSERGPGTPNRGYVHWVYITNTFGDIVITPSQTIVIPVPVAPPSPTVTERTPTSVTFTVPEQTGATSYSWQVNDVTYVSGRTLQLTGLDPNTSYAARVKASVNNVSGPYSLTTTTTTRRPNYTPGRYVLRPVDASTLAPGTKNYWKGAGAGLQVGESRPFTGNTRGHQGSYLFYNYNSNAHQTLRDALAQGAEITDVQLFLKRENTNHGTKGADSRRGLQIATHTYDAQPSESLGKDDYVGLRESNHGWARGEGKWVNLPNWMGYQLVEGRKGVRGLRLGRYFAPYYIFKHSDESRSGNVEITIK